MESKTMERFNSWLRDPHIDEDSKKELMAVKDDESEIEDRFFKDLEFGTAGIRGVIGAGTNRMNKYVVGKSTQGLADYISSKGEGAKDRGVVIAHDSRRMSREFSLEAAQVLAGNGIKAYLFDDLRPTPELSFAIRHLNCISGIVVTASHNPAEYNGYKVYWEDGAQIATERAGEIIEAIAGVKDHGSIKEMEYKQAMELGFIVQVGEDVDDEYITQVKHQSLRGELIEKVAKDFKIVFTPLHGTGNVPVRRVLREIGFENVMVVPEQEMPDPKFSTVKFPNPEDIKAFELAIKFAKKEGAHLILGTDPDCDRVGALVKDDTGEYIVLSGNQIGALLVHYILEALKEKDMLPPNGTIVKSIVTAEMGTNIAKAYGIEMVDTLTGFKYIGEKIKEFERTKEKVFLFGYEESYGYLAGTYARDKDAVVASMLIAEMAAYYYSKGMNLYDALMDLYERYGYFLEDVVSVTLEGKDGLKKINAIMRYFRNGDICEIAGKRVLYLEDYELHRRISTKSPEASTKIELPKADVVKFILENEGWVCIRPSGTEPKLKIYGAVRSNCIKSGKKDLDELMDWTERTIKGI